MLPVTLSYDDTGRSPANRVVQEGHVLTQQQDNLIVLNHGMFYADDSLSIALITDPGTPLTAKTDYTFQALDPELTMVTGRPVAGAIVFGNHITANVLVTYQAVGGKRGRSNPILNDVWHALQDIRNRGIDYSQIKNPPTHLPAGPHDHSVKDLTELDAVRNTIDQLTEALVGNRPLAASSRSLQERLDAITSVISTQRRSITDIQVLLSKIDLTATFDASAVTALITALTARVAALETTIQGSAAINPGAVLSDTETTGVISPYRLWLVTPNITGIVSRDLPHINVSNNTWFQVRNNSSATVNVTIPAIAPSTINGTTPAGGQMAITQAMGTITFYYQSASNNWATT